MLFNAKNESHQQPAINLQIARAYLMAIDPLVAQRSWQRVMAEIVKFKTGSTLQRWQTAIKDKAFDSIRSLPLLETQAEQLLRVLEQGTVSTNVHLRKLHNFCLDMNWLPWHSPRPSLRSSLHPANVVAARGYPGCRRPGHAPVALREFP